MRLPHQLPHGDWPNVMLLLVGFCGVPQGALVTSCGLNCIGLNMPCEPNHGDGLGCTCPLCENCGPDIGSNTPPAHACDVHGAPACPHGLFCACCRAISSPICPG